MIFIGQEYLRNATTKYDILMLEKAANFSDHTLHFTPAIVNRGILWPSSKVGMRSFHFRNVLSIENGKKILILKDKCQEKNQQTSCYMCNILQFSLWPSDHITSFLIEALSVFPEKYITFLLICFSFMKPSMSHKTLVGVRVQFSVRLFAFK